MSLSGRRIIVGGVKIQGKEARQLIRDAFRDARRRSTTRYKPLLLSLLVSLISVATYVLLADALIPAWPKPWRTIAIALGAFVLGLFIGRTLYVVHLRANRESILRAMRSRGFELCTNCGYWLKGLADDVRRCPECGKRREPTP